MASSGWSSDVCSSDLLISACARANNVLKRFGTGWALFFEAARREALGYPDSRFPDAASWLVDQERRARFEAAGAHYESPYPLTLTWLPAAARAATAGRTLVSPTAANLGRDVRCHLTHFIDVHDHPPSLLPSIHLE